LRSRKWPCELNDQILATAIRLREKKKAGLLRRKPKLRYFQGNGLLP